jgi:NDP-sugar pyrophosphorylase family protein
MVDQRRKPADRLDREKPIQRHLSSGGLYVFSPDVLALIPRNQRYDMRRCSTILPEGE